MKTLKKQHQVILVPTDEHSSIFKKGDRVYYTFDDTDPPKGSGKNQFLYILSDEKIKEGDWGTDGVFLVLRTKGNSHLFEECNPPAKKIIATSEINKEWNKENPPFSAPYDYTNLIPNISEQFIEKWVDKGCPEFINVEYIIISKRITAIDNEDGYMMSTTNLKILSDNTILCSLIEYESPIKMVITCEFDLEILKEKGFTKWFSDYSETHHGLDGWRDYDNYLDEVELPKELLFTLIHKWLRDIHNIDVDVIRDSEVHYKDETRWIVKISNWNDIRIAHTSIAYLKFPYHTHHTDYKSYEDAMEFGLQEGLKLIK